MTEKRFDEDKRITLNAETVADYLLAHPEFLYDHKTLLTRLSVPHPAGGAVSLIERQVELLRHENRTLERKLVDLLEVARHNDRLISLLHRLAVDLLSNDDPHQRLITLENALRQGFRADEVAVLLTVSVQRPSIGIVRFHGRGDNSFSSLRSVVDQDAPTCGPISENRRQILFPETDQIHSAALIPLGSLGLLAVGSVEMQHFHPSLDTLYLRRLGELTATALAPLAT